MKHIITESKCTEAKNEIENSTATVWSLIHTQMVCAFIGSMDHNFITNDDKIILIEFSNRFSIFALAVAAANFINTLDFYASQKQMGEMKLRCRCILFGWIQVNFIGFMLTGR